jgi:hypothetical protein
MQRMRIRGRIRNILNVRATPRRFIRADLPSFSLVQLHRPALALRSCKACLTRITLQHASDDNGQ